MAEGDDDRFLDEAVARGLLTREQADECRRLRTSLAEVEVALTVDEVLARKAFLSRERSAELRRSLARQRVGRFEVLERLGEGGSGVVWKARDVVLDRVVALKLLSRAGRDDPVWRERFLREARTAVALNHAGIVRGLDCGEDDGHLWFAMEYVAGESLSARLRREGRLPEREVMRIGAEVARVLRYVADRGMVHRDLKPDNLIIALDGRVRVCDLGLAKPTLEEAERVGADAVVAGTPLYVAPEQIRDGDRVDWRADVYSLGATLYHLLAGRPPFPWEKGKDLLACHLREIPRSPREFVPDASPGAAAVILKMLQKDPADRYARLEELESDLESVMTGRPPVHTITFAPKERLAVAPEAAPARTWSPWKVAAAATLFVVAAAATGAVLFATSSTPPWGPSPPLRQSDDPSDPSPGDTPGPPDVPGPTRPNPPPPPSPAEAAAADALESARRFATSNPDDLRAQRDAFRFVADRHAGTDAAAVADGVAREIDGRIEATADAALAAARKDAADAEAADRHVDAARLLEAVAAAHPATRAAAAAAADAKRLHAAARDRVARLLDEAFAAIDAHDHAGARSRLTEAAATGVAGAEREIAAARRRLDAAEAAFTENRAASRAAFERLWGGAVLRAGDEGVKTALAALDEARAELPTWVAECDTLRLDILSIDRAQVDPPASAGPAAVRAAFFARLAQRDFAGAESLLPRVGSPAATELREGLRRVRGVLASAADELLVLADAARIGRRWDDADRLVARAFAQVPSYPRARVVAAAILADRGRVDEALALLEDVLSQPGPPPEAHLRLGQILAARRDATARAQFELEQFLTHAAGDDPLRAEARAALEAVTVRRNAARVRELLIELNAARERDDFEKVIDVATAIQAISPTDVKSLLALGEAYAETGRPHDAFFAWRRVADGKPYEREWPKAQAALRKLDQRWQAAPRDRDATAAATASLARGEVEEARAQFDEILARSPFLEDALLGGAEAWIARKGSGSYALREDARRALRLTDILLLKNPSHVRALEVRAEALLRTGAAKEALELAERLLPLDPVRPDPATTAGFACLALEDHRAALEHLKTSLDRRRTALALYGRVLAWEGLARRQSARDEALVLVEEFGVPDELKTEFEALLARLDIEFVRPPR